jgi:hypothetical protein
MCSLEEGNFVDVKGAGHGSALGVGGFVGRVGESNYYVRQCEPDA